MALRNPAIERVLLVSPVVDVPLLAWNASGDELPIILSRSVTIEGDSQLSDWPALRLHFVKGTVRLANQTTLTFRSLALDGGRSDNPTRAPGIDMLTPTLLKEQATLVLGPGAMITQACYPASYQRMNLQGLPRVSGSQAANLFDLGKPQDGCVNSTDTPYMRRCWADKSLLVDFVVWGADNVQAQGQGFSTVPNGLLVRVVNLVSLCRVRVDYNCLLLARREPYVCYLEAVNSLLTTSSPSGSGDGGGGASAAAEQQRLAAAPPPPAAGSTAAPAGSTLSFAGLTAEQRLIVALCASLVGGSIAVLVVAATVVMIRRQVAAARAAAANANGGAGGTAVAALAAGAAEPMGLRSESTKSTYSKGAATAATAFITPSPGSKSAASAGGGAIPSPSRRRRGGLVGDGDVMPGLASTMVAATAKVAGGEFSDSLSRYQDCTEEIFLQSDFVLQDTAEKPQATMEDRTAPPAAGFDGGGACYGGGGSCDVPVTPYTPHRPSLTLGVALTGTPMADAAGCFDHGGPAAYNGSSLQVISMNPTASYTLIDSSAALTPITAGEVGVGGGGGGGGNGGGAGPSEGIAVVELLPVLLGKGAYGRVYEGLYGGQRVAVKVMASLYPGAASETFARSFVQEVHVLGRCQHPNIVRLLAAALEPPKLCLVMELMETSLERLLHGDPSRPLLPLSKVLHIGMAVANALAYLHPTIVHRDLKPANVLVDNAGHDRPTVKISDFGLSRLRLTVVPTETPEAGTPSYMAPECFDITNSHITHQADMFSFGVLMWEMLAGERPWWGMQPVTVALMVSHHGARLSLSRLPPERLPGKLAQLLNACWEADPTRRPAAAEAVKELAVLHQGRWEAHQAQVVRGEPTYTEAP